MPQATASAPPPRARRAPTGCLYGEWTELGVARFCKQRACTTWTRDREECRGGPGLERTCSGVKASEFALREADRREAGLGVS